MFDLILKGLLNSGPIGLVLAFFMWMNYKLIIRLFTVIETNTTAWTNTHEKLNNMEIKQDRRRDNYK